MKFLIDQNLSHEVAARLVAAGHDAVHVRERGLQRASDEAVLETATAEGRVLVSGDTDFGMLLARSGATEPSFLLFRQRGERRAAQQALLVLETLDRRAPPRRTLSRSTTLWRCARLPISWR